MPQVYPENRRTADAWEWSSRPMMLSHKQIWDGIDLLAARNSLSASALAKRAGLDPTTFNKSKRTTKQGKPRWPSTESLSKILEATSTNIGEFVALFSPAAEAKPASYRLRSATLSQIASGPPLDEVGFPVAGHWDEVDLPAVDDIHSYVIEIDTDFASPLLRPGDHVLVTPSAKIRHGDRVVSRLRADRIVAGVLIRRTTRRTILTDLKAPHEELAIPTEEIIWLSRIAWISP